MNPLSTFGIGSVPFVKGKNSCEAIFKQWDIPFWPQYPARSLKENFVFQFLSSFPALQVAHETAVFDPRIYEKEVKIYRDQLHRAFSENQFLAFEPPPEWAQGYHELKSLLERRGFPDKQVIKLQVTGPGTVWNSFFSSKFSQEDSPAVLNDISLALTAAGLSQIDRIYSYGRTPLILIDEPLRLADPTLLKQMVRSFKKTGAWVGLHVCSDSNWDNLDDLDLDLFHFDLSCVRQSDSSRPIFLKSLLEKGGWIAWGVVPTNPKIIFKEKDCWSILLNWIGVIEDSSLGSERILGHSLLAPACGTGALTPEADQKVIQILLETAEGLKSSYFPS